MSVNIESLKDELEELENLIGEHKRLAIREPDSFAISITIESFEARQQELREILRLQINERDHESVASPFRRVVARLGIFGLAASSAIALVQDLLGSTTRKR